jgi:hypothetical protein
MMCNPVMMLMMTMVSKEILERGNLLTFPTFMPSCNQTNVRLRSFAEGDRGETKKACLQYLYYFENFHKISDALIV